MHVTTRLAVALPRYEFKKSDDLFLTFASKLKQILGSIHQGKYQELANEAYDFFIQSPELFTFTKTCNKSLIRYVADFDYQLNSATIERSLPKPEQPAINQFVCDKTSQYWLSQLMKDPENAKDYIYVEKLIERKFG